MSAPVVGYFKTLCQVRRNLAYECLEDISGPKSCPELELRKAHLQGRISAFKLVLADLEDLEVLTPPVYIRKGDVVLPEGEDPVKQVDLTKPAGGGGT